MWFCQMTLYTHAHTHTHIYIYYNYFNMCSNYNKLTDILSKTMKNLLSSTRNRIEVVQNVCI